MNTKVLDFYADWCGPCKIMAPIIKELETEFPAIEFVKLDADVEDAEVNQYGIMSIPTLVILKDGKEVSRLIGAQSKETIKKLL